MDDGTDDPREVERRFVVRLAVQASESDPTAVRALLDRLLRGGLERFTYTVDDSAGGRVEFLVSPTEYSSFFATLDQVWDEPVERAG